VASAWLGPWSRTANWTPSRTVTFRSVHAGYRRPVRSARGRLRWKPGAPRETGALGGALAVAMTK